MLVPPYSARCAMALCTNSSAERRLDPAWHTTSPRRSPLHTYSTATRLSLSRMPRASVRCSTTPFSVFRTMTVLLFVLFHPAPGFRRSRASLDLHATSLDFQETERC